MSSSASVSAGVSVCRKSQSSTLPRRLACRAVRRIAAALLLACAAAAPAAAVEPRGWHPDAGAARAFADARRGEVAFAVRTRERHWSYRGGVRYRSASVVKAMLLVAYLRRPDVRGRALGA